MQKQSVSTVVPVDPIVAHVASLLTRLGVFRFQNSNFANELAARCDLVSVPGGGVLLEEGDAPGPLYIVVSGILAVHKKRSDGSPSTLINRIGPGELVGEMGLISGEPRMATVRALRNSELISIARDDLEALAARNPAVVWAICDTVVRRLRNSYEFTPPPFRPRTLCLVPHDASVNANTAAETIADALKPFGTLVLVDKDRATRQGIEWLSDQEKAHDFVLYVADPTATAWSRFCLRQSDCVLILARGDAAITDAEALGPERRHLPENIPVYLVLLWSEIRPGTTQDWLARINPKAHYHVRSLLDFARAMRLTVGRGIGVVLSGGGARGIAHVGVIRALQEQGIQVDAIGGTSIGALAAAGAALEWDVIKTARAWADAFARQRITDFAIPRVSIYSPRKLNRTLGRWFGEIRIEDAPIPFYCVSCNLMDGVQAVHRVGPFATWLQASTAIPGVLPPVIVGGRVHVDGGVVNNLPADVMRDLGVSTIIAVDVSSDFDPAWQLGTNPEPGAIRSPSLIDLLCRVGTISSGARVEAARHCCSILLQPNVRGIGRLNWRACEQAIEAGYRAAMDNMPAIKIAVAAGTQ